MCLKGRERTRGARITEGQGNRRVLSHIHHEKKPVRKGSDKRKGVELDIKRLN